MEHQTEITKSTKTVEPTDAGVPQFGDQLVSLGSDTVYENYQAAIAGLQQKIMALCNEHLHYDVFFRTWEGHYVAAAFDVQLVGLPPEQEQMLGIMDVKGRIPKQATFAGRASLLEEWYEATRAVHQAADDPRVALEDVGKLEARANELYERLRALDAQHEVPTDETPADASADRGS